MSKQVCLVTGVGPGTGRAIAQRFASEYAVAMLARDAERLQMISAEGANLHPYPCDVSDEDALKATIARITDDLGAPSVVVHNAVGAVRGDVLSIKASSLERNFRINTTALLHLAQACAPAMLKAGQGAFVCTGNTAAYRGAAYFAGFAPTKAAQRILCESMARSLGPQGIHVAYLAIDAVIDLEWTRKAYPDKPDDFFCQPGHIADECWHLVHQPRSAWTFSNIIRPFGEQFALS